MNALPDRAHDVHTRLLAAVRACRTAEHTAAKLLREVADHKLHHAFGYASIHDDAEHELDLSLRQTRDLLQIGGALPDLPAVDAAFSEGRLSWTKVRELVRVVTPETEAEWVAAAEGRTSRAVEALVSQARVGDRPAPEPPHPRGPARRRVVFELEASDAAVLFDALAVLRAEASLHGAELDDGAALAAMAQRVILDADGDHTPIAERYRVVVQRCPTCGDECAADHDLSETVARQAACDAEVVDLRPGPRHGHLSRTIPPATRRAVLHRDRLRCVVPDCRCHLWLDVHHLQDRALGGTHDPSNLVTLCPLHHRLVHEGLLAVRRMEDGRIEAEHASGRVSVSRRTTWGTPGGGGATTHVGRARAAGSGGRP